MGKMESRYEWIDTPVELWNRLDSYLEAPLYKDKIRLGLPAALLASTQSELMSA